MLMVVDGILDVVDGRVVVVTVDEMTPVDETVLELVDDGCADGVGEPDPLIPIQTPRSDHFSKPP